MKTKLQSIHHALRLGIMFMILMMVRNNVTGQDPFPCEMGAITAQDTRLLQGFPPLKRSETEDAPGFGCGALVEKHSIENDQFNDVQIVRRFPYQRIVEGLGTTFLRRTPHAYPIMPASRAGWKSWVKRRVTIVLLIKFAKDGTGALPKMAYRDLQPFTKN